MRTTEEADSMKRKIKIGDMARSDRQLAHPGTV